MLKNTDIWYLYHSGFAVVFGSRLLIFDYYRDTPCNAGKQLARSQESCSGLALGVIRPEDLKGRETIVFSSHSHQDHFNPVILDWAKHSSNIAYVLSDEIRIKNAPSSLHYVRPGESCSVKGMEITTLDSTDEGTAFLVNIEGTKIFHAGDLNWWHWNGEPEDDNKAMGIKYKAEISKLKGIEIDAAFIPVDPRLEEHYILGIDYFMSEVGAKAVFPMHFGDNYSIFEELLRDKRTEAYRNKIMVISQRGQHFKL